MNLTPEQRELGRRNFLKALAGTPALAALGGAIAWKGPVTGGPVRVGFIGVGTQGRALLGVTGPPFADVRAVCDINPTSLQKADEILAKNKQPPARHYAEWQDMLQKEDIEAVVMAPPLWKHAELASGCLEAGKHVLCEKMMAWDAEGCERMRAAAQANNRVLEIGYQRFYSALYQSAYEGIIKAGVLGDIYHSRLAWHRNGNWRRQGEPPSKDYDPSKWGYPTFEHLLNWRLYWKYSQGLFAELASHQLNVANWFFDSKPEAVSASGGVYRFKDGREVYDHVYATFEYPHGRTAVFSSIESNAFDDYYEMFMGTKGTLIILREVEALLFEEGGGERSTSVAVSARGEGPAAETTETQPANRPGSPATAAPAQGQVERRASSRSEVERFCAAVRVGTPIACGPDRAIGSAVACTLANHAIEKKTRLTV
jgi:predicted dehydrogenase